jgi:hypothetical protein
MRGVANECRGPFAPEIGKPGLPVDPVNERFSQLSPSP